MKNLKNKLRNFDSKRKKFSKKFELIFLKKLYTQTIQEKTTLKNEDVKKILIIRNNTRIGNVIFLLPFVNEVIKNYPNAKVDLLLTETWQGKIFENININKIHYSNFRFKTMFNFFKQMKELKKQEYDLAFIPFNGSSDLFVSSFIKSKNLISSKNDKSDILCTHTYEKDDNYKHYALEPLCIINKHLKTNQRDDYSPYLEFSQNEKDKAIKYIQKNINKKNKQYNIAYFRGARGSKLIDDKLWEKNLQKINLFLDDDVNFVEIMSSDIPKKLNLANDSFETKNLRDLGCFLKNMDCFISADTGPLHLASASKAKCFGIYNKTSPQKYGTLGHKSINITDFENLDLKKFVL